MLRLLQLAVAASLIASGAAQCSASGDGIQTPPAVRSLEIAVGDMVFDARAAGPEDGPLVLLLHGFPQTSYSYVEQLEYLSGLGYYAVAPDQRGYSPRARPEGVESYAMRSLVGDVVGLANALGRERFHLVGHDWGGAVAWAFASAFPGRLESLTVLSTPHYGAFGAALSDPSSEQAERSSYFEEWSKPGAETEFLADDAEKLRAILGPLDPDSVEAYLSVLGEPAALRAALHWYGALQSSRSAPPPNGAQPTAAPAPPPISVRTLYVWGEDDSAFSHETAEATARFVSGPHRFVPLAGLGHWLTETAPDRINELLGEHLGPAPGDGPGG